MRYLLDTHVLIWHGENRQFNQAILNIINDPTNTILVSHATLWEMTIKVSIGKLKLNFPIADFSKLLITNQFINLPFDFKHYEVLSQLPFHHQDPFDRMLVWEALQSNIPFISKDENVEKYQSEGLVVIW